MIKKVLLLPFLRMTSGHHRVADNIQQWFSTHSPHTVCNKVDILHYAYGSFERFITKCYLQWIRLSPDSYHFIYSALAGSNMKNERKHHRMYEMMFIGAMRRLLRDEQPDLIFCTHSLPSYILSLLKQREELDVPVINVYTDFFINNLWGTQGIDQHWVSDLWMKKSLMEKGVPENNIITTGIPVNRDIRTNHPQANSKPPFTILVSGGNLGVGGLEEFVRKLGSLPLFKYIVLCGKNERLYKKLLHQHAESRIKPLPYIDSPEEMRRIYEEVDAVFCKPGGVTISECLLQKKPVFVFGALPGQETYNLRRLKQRRLIWDAAELTAGRKDVEQAVADILMSDEELARWRKDVERFNEPICNWDDMLEQIVASKAPNRLDLGRFLRSPLVK